ncbi:protease modulator HflC [Candidatus Fermentibacteria bacterium]|nr:protease modulator HflC [Candidatus Fermentibacteria bacterium]
MSGIRKIIYGVIALFVLLLITGAFFVVSETEQAVILQLGKPIRVIAGDRPEDERRELGEWMSENEPDVALSFGAGLYFKIPLLQQVRKFEDRLLEYDDDPSDVVTKDKKHIQIDAYARWRIINPLLFLQSVQIETQARSRLDDIIYSVIRQELGRKDLIQIVRNSNHPVGLGDYVRLVDNVSEADSMPEMQMEGGELIEVIKLVRIPESAGRINILNRVTGHCRQKAAEYGIVIEDVWIKRADLPPENEQAVFGRMQAERNRMSTRYRAEGRRMSRRITAETDLRVDSISARAERIALTTRGGADSLAAAIYAEAYNQYPDFYRFVNSLETMSSVMDTTARLVLPTEGIFQYLVSRPGEFR